MSTTRDEKIAPTAHYTAYVWSRLGLPYAEHFATRKGAAVFWATRFSGEWLTELVPRLPSMTQYLELRHRLIERALDEHAPDRIVEIGAGLSRRGVTWAVDRGVSYLEIDLPHMVAAKRARLAELPAPVRAKLAARMRVIAQDILAPDFTDALRAELANATRPAVIAEGVMGYFPRDLQLRIASAIRAALPPSGIFLCDLRASGEGGAAVAIAARALKAGIRVITRGRGAHDDFRNMDDVRAFFSEAGYASSSPMDQATLPHLAHLRTPARIWRAQAG
jgi:O-methyltransferase involved in polyketide biosynthesis